MARWLVLLAVMFALLAPAGASGTQQAARSWVTNEAGLAIIEKTEGLRLQAYGSGGIWRIGYGHSTNVKQGQTISAAQARAFLQNDVKVCETAIGQLIRVPITQNEFSALVSLCFTTGAYALRKATVIARLNSGDRAGAANGFLLWVKTGGKPLPHLVVRRNAERDLFLK